MDARRRGILELAPTSESEPDRQQGAAQLQGEVVTAAEMVIEPDHAVARLEPGLRAPRRPVEPVADVADEVPVQPVAAGQAAQVAAEVERDLVVDRDLSAHTEHGGGGGEAPRDLAAAALDATHHTC